MSIDNISPYSFSGTVGDNRYNGKIPGTANEATFDISDGFTHVGDVPDMRIMSSLSASDINSVVLNTKSLDKGQFRYKVRSQEQGPDGTMFIAYSDWEKPNGNYISAVKPDGTVKWESRAGDKGLEDIKVGPDGTVYARTKTELVAFDGDGIQKFRHTFEGEVKDHWVDNQGNNYFRQCRGNGFYVVDKEGNRLELPPHLKDSTPNEVKVTPDGAFWCRQGNTMTRIDPNQSDKGAGITFEDPAEKKKCNLDTFFPAPDGGVYVKGTLVEFIPTPDYGDLHLGLGMGGMHFGGHHFGSHAVGPFDDFPQGTSFTDNFIFKLDPSGKIQWKSGNIGSHPEVQAASTGDLFIYDDKMNGQKKYDISKMAPGGTTGVFASFDESINKMAIRPGDDHVFAQSGKTLTELAPDGSVVRTKSLDGPEGYKFHGFDKNGNVLLTDKDSNKLYSWDAGNDSITRLSDHEKDYSYKITLKEAEKLDSTGSAEQTPVIEQGENSVNVDGVELTKKKKKKSF